MGYNDRTNNNTIARIIIKAYTFEMAHVPTEIHIHALIHQWTYRLNANVVENVFMLR